jgi:hypothetical protein
VVTAAQSICSDSPSELVDALVAEKLAKSLEALGYDHASNREVLLNFGCW